MRSAIVTVALLFAGCGSDPVPTHPVELAPGTVTLAPRAHQAFTATGGTTPYAWSNAGGGTIDATTGAYIAAGTPNITDTVTVTDADGATATASIAIGAGITITPPSAMTYGGTTIAFAATGGSGTGFTWTLAASPSGGSIDATTGAYTAGFAATGTDVVSVSDDLGNTATSAVTVRALQIYVADTENHRIVRVDDMTGTNFVAYGTSGTGTGQFGRGIGLYVDTDGKIYIADQSNTQVVRMDDMTGTNVVAYGTAGTGTGQFSGPTGITVDAMGRIYVADFNGSRITRMDDMTGTGFVSFGTTGAGTGQFTNPVAISIDELGKIYVADSGNNRIVRIDDMTGAGFVSFSTGLLTTDGVMVAGGKIFIADSGNERIVRIDDMTGAGLVSFGTMGAGSGQFRTPAGIAVDTAGRIYVGDYLNNRIVRTDISGTDFVSYGTAGSGDGQFSSPFGVFVR